MTDGDTEGTESRALAGEPIDVLLLGTYHMDNPGLDTVNVEADDVLDPQRQRELERLTDQLAGWEADLVAVERPQARQDELNELFDRYRDGSQAYDQETKLEPLHPQRDDPTTECRSEVVQVGFRLADRLGHDRVAAIDYPMTMAANLDPEETEQLDEAAVHRRAVERLDMELPDQQAYRRKLEEHLVESTVTDHLRFLNREENLRPNHLWMFADALAGLEERYVGTRILLAWYERNLRMLENLWRTGTDADRILLLAGTGHVRILRHLLEEAPMFRHRTPMPLLMTEDD